MIGSVIHLYSCLNNIPHVIGLNLIRKVARLLQYKKTFCDTYMLIL